MCLILQPSVVVVMAMSVSPSFPDEKHPLKPAHDSDFMSGWMSERIKDLMKAKGLSINELAKQLPKKDGTPVKYTYAASLVRQPELATDYQVEALCKILGCTLDYLRAESHVYADRTVSFGGAQDMAALYARLSDADKRAVWEHAEALLYLHSRNEYSRWYVWDSPYDTIS